MNSLSRALYLCLMLGFLCIKPSLSHAHNKVVVIPMSGDDSKPLQNVISVAKSNGDFADPIAALASIDDESQDNPYLIVIAPGVYELSEQLEMREYIDIAGSGRELTRLIGSASSDFAGRNSALLINPTNAALRDLTIENSDGVNPASVGYFCNTQDVVSPRVSNVDILLSGGQQQVGLFTNESCAPILEDVNIGISDGSGEQTGVVIGTFSRISMTRSNIIVEGSSFPQHGFTASSLGYIRLVDTTVRVLGGSNESYGALLNDNGTIELINSRFFLNNSGTIQRGIRLNSNSRASLNNSSINLAGSAAFHYGISRTDSSRATVRGSTISASSRSIVRVSGGTPRTDYISDSFLSNAPTGQHRCSFVFLNNDTPLNSNCDVTSIP